MEYGFSQGMRGGLSNLSRSLLGAAGTRQQAAQSEMDAMMGADLKFAQAQDARAKSELSRELLRRRQNMAADLETSGAAAAGMTLPEYRAFLAFQRSGSMPQTQTLTADPTEPVAQSPQFDPARLAAGRRALAAMTLGGQMKDIDPLNVARAGGEYQQQQTSDMALDAVRRGDMTAGSALNQMARPGQAVKLFENVGNTGATFSPTTGSVQTDNPLAKSAIAENEARAKKANEGKADELAGILRAAGVDPASPQGQALYRSLALKMATHQPANQTTVVTRMETEESKAVGKAMGEAFNAIQTAGVDANAKIARWERLKQLLDGVNTGRLTPAGTELAAWADSVGLKLDPKLGNKQAAVALSNEIALTLRNPSGGAGMPGALSDKDREFLVSMVPSLATSPQGNAQLIETAQKIAKRDQEVARLAREYRQRRGTLDPGFYDELQRFSDANPLFGPRSVVNFQGGAAGGGTPAPSAPRTSPQPGGGRVVVDF